MKLRFTFFLAILLLTGCKKYLDPKFTYEQPIFEADINGTRLIADSSIAKKDSIRYGTTWKKTTRLFFFKNSDTLFKIQLNGRSIGSYDIDSFTQFSYNVPNDTMVYEGYEGKFVIWAYDSMVSGDLNLKMANQLGEMIELKNGKFVGCKIKK